MEEDISVEQEKYVYFVSFIRVGDGTIAFSNAEIATESPINGFDAIIEIQGVLKERYAEEEPVILNYQLMR